MTLSPSSVARNFFRIAILVIVAVDAVWLAHWFVGSQCTFMGTAAIIYGRNPVDRAYQRLDPQVRLQRTDGGLNLWSTPEGNVWDVHGNTILPMLMAEQQLDIYELAGHEVRRGDVVLDCGANIGLFTRKALSRGAALVVAIEPAPLTLEALRRNLEGEIRSGRVIVYPKGVWDREDQLQLSIDEINQAADSLVTGDARAPTVRVPLTTIDRIVAELKLPRVDFIKMDIEGAEKPAIRGAKETLQRFRPRMSLSSEHLPDDFTAIPALVKSIEPRYRYQGCDCEAQDRRAKARVLAFDPLP